jgi:nitroreductase
MAGASGALFWLGGKGGMSAGRRSRCLYYERQVQQLIRINSRLISKAFSGCILQSASTRLILINPLQAALSLYRLCEQPGRQDGQAMDLKEAIYTRRATREFTPAPVDETTIRELIDAAIQAPSAVNQQPCAFCVIRDKSVLTNISRQAKAHLLRSEPIAFMSQHFQEISNDKNFDIFYDTPVLIVISAMADMPWAVEDCALAAENLMLAARGAGLGSCWIGFAQMWLATSEGKAALKLPDAYKPVAPIIVGHPKSLPSPVPRRSPEIRWI